MHQRFELRERSGYKVRQRDIRVVSDIYRETETLGSPVRHRHVTALSPYQEVETSQPPCPSRPVCPVRGGSLIEIRAKL